MVTLALLVLAATLLPGCSAAPSGTPTPSTADTGKDTLTIHYMVWEDDRQCWALRYVDRPAAAWASYVEHSCDMREGTFNALQAIGEGHCGLFQGRFRGDCAVEDPGWLLPCSDLPGCCDHDRRQESQCIGDVYWQP